MEKYHIVSNTNGRRILVVNKLLEIEKTPELAQNDFDAIFINIAHRAYEENRLILRWLSPIRVQKCYLKPLFATSSLKEYMNFAVYLIDGFCESPFDTNFTDHIEIIYENIEKYKIRTASNNDLPTITKNFANFIKYEISRGHLTYTNTAIKGYAKGYTETFLSWYDNQETLMRNERMELNQKMTELGLAQKIRTIDRIHTCPVCGDSHLIFLESCPQCKSSDIKEESIIHHFRCANVSPESTYLYDGELRCPKCKKMLKHIGVDYDRPASMYTCQECGKTFINSEMRVKCTNCGTNSSPNKLKPLNVQEYRLTQKGIDAFASDEAILLIKNQIIFSGRCTYEEFQDAIYTFTRIPSYQEYILLIYRYQYNKSNETGTDSWRILNVIHNILSKLTTLKITSHHNEILILHLIKAETEAEEKEHIEPIIEHLFQEHTVYDKAFKAKLLNVYTLNHNDNPEDIIKSLDMNVPSKREEDNY